MPCCSAAVCAHAVPRLHQVYVDTVGSSERYEEFLTKAFDGRIKFTVSKKADSLFPVVSAASICAKVRCDVVLRKRVSLHMGVAYSSTVLITWFGATSCAASQCHHSSRLMLLLSE